MPDGVFVGLSTIDLILAVDEFPSANTKVIAHSQEMTVGGPAANAAITFSHLGKNSALVTAIGCNQLADIIRAELDHHSVEPIDLVPGYGGLPAISSIWVDREGRRSIVSVNTSVFPAPSSEVDLKQLTGARILLVDGHFMDVCQAWAHAARVQGIPVVLDGGSWKPDTERLLASVDIAICSADFLPSGCSGEDEVIALLHAHGVQKIAITHGAEPIRYASGSSSGIIPVPQVNVLDTTGAGDILHGAFCFYFSTGCDFVTALKEAALIASESCTYRGTRVWMRERSQPKTDGIF